MKSFVLIAITLVAFAPVVAVMLCACPTPGPVPPSPTATNVCRHLEDIRCYQPKTCAAVLTAHSDGGTSYPVAWNLGCLLAATDTESATKCGSVRCEALPLDQ